MYHIVCPAKYRREVISKEVDKKLREICLGIEARYEIKQPKWGNVYSLCNNFINSWPPFSLRWPESWKYSL
jgi:hypothetical protein